MSRSVVRRGLVVVVVVLVGVLGTALSAQTASAAPQLPSQDPFYAFSGSLNGVAPGTVLRSRSIPYVVDGLSVPVRAEQLLYRTVNGVGAPDVAVTTVLHPLVGLSNKLVSWQMAYDGLAGNCDPSFAIQGGTPTEATNPVEQDLLTPLLVAGDTVVVSDYEGEGNDFVGGREEGDDTLDGIRAAEGYLGASATATQVVLQGYSGGAIASGWASVLAPSYAPELDIVGTAMGGIVVDLAHNLNYINGSTDWAGAIPAALVGVSRSLHINLKPYLSAYGQSVVSSVSGACLQSAVADYPGLTYQKMFKPQYQDLTKVPVFVRAFNELNMAHGGTPRDPLYMGVGDSDGTGDGVMVTADDEALAHTFCTEGLPVEFNVYKGENHGTAAVPYLLGAVQFIEGRLNGAAPTNGCASIGTGNSLALLPTPAGAPQHAHPRAALQIRRCSNRSVHLRLRDLSATTESVRVLLLGRHGGVWASRRTVLRPHRLTGLTLSPRHHLAPGRYTVVVRDGSRTLAHRSVVVRRPRTRSLRERR